MSQSVYFQTLQYFREMNENEFMLHLYVLNYEHKNMHFNLTQLN